MPAPSGPAPAPAGPPSWANPAPAGPLRFPPGPATGAARQRKRPRWPLLVAATLLLALAVAAVLTVLLSDRTGSETGRPASSAGTLPEAGPRTGGPTDIDDGRLRVR